MAKTGYLNARIDAGLKVKAEKIFATLDVSPSQAIAMFYRQVVLRRGLPFDVCIPNETTLAALEEAEVGGGQVIHGSVSDAFDEIIAEDHTRRE